MKKMVRVLISPAFVAVLLVLFPKMTISSSRETTVDALGNIHHSTNNQNENLPHTNSPAYGVDVSWPMQNKEIQIASNPLQQETRQSMYDEYMAGCGEMGSGFDTSRANQDCQRWEEDRLSMNRNQPSISQNYTYAGYASAETPHYVHQILQKVWNEHKAKMADEVWERSNTYLNHWSSPTQIIDIKLYLTKEQQKRLVKEVQTVLEAWTRQSLVLTSLYGIRVYGKDAILAPHVDRLPLVSSAIINVAQDIEEPWPLEVIGHDNQATNLTVETGGMILYESHSVIHGRPFPLRGNHYANVFVHFEPIGHSIRHSLNAPSETAQTTYERALEYQKRSSQHERESETDRDAPTPVLPSYVPKESATRWWQHFEFEKDPKISPKPTNSLLAAVNPHHAAADGLLHVLKEIAAVNKAHLFKKDHNGWTPLHEAARSGYDKVIKYLLDQGAKINERTNNGSGGTPLWLAEQKQRTEAIALLKEYGAVSIPPQTREQSEASARVKARRDREKERLERKDHDDNENEDDEDENEDDDYDEEPEDSYEFRRARRQAKREEREREREDENNEDKD